MWYIPPRPTLTFPTDIVIRYSKRPGVQLRVVETIHPAIDSNTRRTALEAKTKQQDSTQENTKIQLQKNDRTRDK